MFTVQAEFEPLNLASLNDTGDNMKRVLLVDDEQNVISALQRELKGHYETEGFNSPVAALERCRTASFDLVIADYQMPGMDGLEFLKQFGQLQPDASRVLLSGMADIDTLTRMINETHIYRFLAKPWEKTELLSVIEHALACQDRIRQNRMRPAAVMRSAGESPFRIILVEGDEHLLDLISRTLADESGHESLYGAIQQELAQVASAGRFHCVVSGFRDARSALDHIEKNPCDLIVSAYSLPDMDGVQLLSKARALHPDASRILISNALDKPMVSQAINEAEVQSLLHLQWANYELRADARRQAWNLHQLKTAALHALASRALLCN